MGFMMTKVGKLQKEAQDEYAHAGTIAEECLAASRTVTAFNAQHKMSARYNSNLTQARVLGVKKGFALGGGIGMLQFFIYSLQAISFIYGARLIYWGIGQPGDVLNVFMAILIGSFSFGSLAPEITAISLASGAGAKLFETIDRKPPIDVYSKKGTPVDRSKLKGKIAFKGVNFTYPNRPEVPVMIDFNLEVAPGATVALVGPSGSGKSTWYAIFRLLVINLT